MTERTKKPDECFDGREKVDVDIFANWKSIWKLDQQRLQKKTDVTFLSFSDLQLRKKTVAGRYDTCGGSGFESWA